MLWVKKGVRCYGSIFTHPCLITFLPSVTPSTPSLFPAVNHMFEAQGIPLPWSWFIQQLPDWYLKLGTVGLLVTEIAVPPLYFAPIRSLRLAAFYIQVCGYTSSC